MSILVRQLDFDIACGKAKKTEQKNMQKERMRSSVSVGRKENNWIRGKIMGPGAPDIAKVGLGTPITPGLDFESRVTEKAESSGGTDTEGMATKQRGFDKGTDLKCKGVDGASVREIEELIGGTGTWKGEIPLEKEDKERGTDTARVEAS